MKLWKSSLQFLNSWTGTLLIVLFVIFFITQSYIIPSGSMKNSMLIGDMLLGKKYAYGVILPRIPWLELPILPDFNGNGHLIEGEHPRRGEIVIFRYPLDDRTNYVKRVVAVGGDEVIYTKKGLYFRPKEGDSYIAEHYAGNEKRSFFNNKIFVYDPYLNEHPGVHYGNHALDTPNAYDTLRYLSESIAMEVYSQGNEIFFHYKVEEDHFFMMGDNRDGSSDSRMWGSVPYRSLIGTPWVIWMSIDDDYKVRWDRLGKSIEELELKKKQQIQAQNQESNHALKEAAEELGQKANP
ncbi:signal peptidase I [Helicobacter monodelphidis]|uniref:signal peptidase I n=1 Tax=Helicobacter sp. 15-1451 TaxID=2004995 RepID=UPI000DCDBE76|nr:signal peptidase I [Helicobacter sp. 15-1451]RAX58140.1 signal peptidase I [Helicobacter sp. 15-1451]